MATSTKRSRRCSCGQELALTTKTCPICGNRLVTTGATVSDKRADSLYRPQGGK